MRTETITALIFVLLFGFVSAVSFSKIQLPRNASGPEALAFELGTGHFFTGVADGRILKYQGPSIGFVDFGFAAPNRSNLTCDGSGTDLASLNPSCGRTFGMALHHQTKCLYVCDAFFGFGVLGPEGGLVTILSTIAEGEPYRLCNSVDVHQPTGNVYFTDASAVYDIRQFETAASVKDSTGRLLKYDVENKQVTVLLRNLTFPGGVAVDEEEEFVLVSEFIGNRIRKIQLQGRNPYESDIVSTRPMPDNIKKAISDGFWIAAQRIDRYTRPSLQPVGERINASGNRTGTVHLQQWYANIIVSEVQEFDSKLYIASPFEDFIGVYEH
ncbi:strictosidine synthase-like [Hibiscus syriacus]|nr:strictosidine synthase-like [Hibiscus syriacus]